MESNRSFFHNLWLEQARSTVQVGIPAVGLDHKITAAAPRGYPQEYFAVPGCGEGGANVCPLQ